jgi:hypothetical protein
MSANVLALRRGAPRRTCSVRTRRDDAGQSCRGRIHVSPCKACRAVRGACGPGAPCPPATSLRMICLLPGGKAAQPPGSKRLLAVVQCVVGRPGLMMPHIENQDFLLSMHTRLPELASHLTPHSVEEFHEHRCLTVMQDAGPFKGRYLVTQRGQLAQCRVHILISHTFLNSSDLRKK